MKKGVTVEQVARVTRAFTDAGIMVHAYLMYGFPTETAQETIDSLERVRQLFAGGLHPVGVLAPLRRDRAQPDRPQPELFGITLRKAPAITFAKNDVAFDDPDRLRSRLLRATACARPSTTTCTALGLDNDPRVVVRQGLRASAARQRAARPRPARAGGRLTALAEGHSSSAPILLARPSAVVTHGTDQNGGLCRTCWVWPQRSSATQSPCSS